MPCLPCAAPSFSASFPPPRQRLESELASRSASLEERQHAAALLAAQQAELQAYAAEVEREQQERLQMEQRIRAMESKASLQPCCAAALLLCCISFYLPLQPPTHILKSQQLWPRGQH